MTLLQKYYDLILDLPTGGGIPDEKGTCPHCGAPTKVTIHKSVKDQITGDIVECDWEEHTYNPFTVSIPDEVKSKSEEYATQMMGLGEYNEKWDYADKCMWETIAKSFRGGYSLASEELARLKEENERLRGEGGEIPIYDISNLSEEEKDELLNETIAISAKVLLHTFMMYGLNNHITGNIINEANGDLFILSFVKVNTPSPTKK